MDGSVASPAVLMVKVVREGRGGMATDGVVGVAAEAPTIVDRRSEGDESWNMRFYYWMLLFFVFCDEICAKMKR